MSLLSRVKQQLVTIYNKATVFQPVAGSAVSSKFTKLGQQAMAELETRLRQHYFDKLDPAYIQSTDGAADLQDHLHGRLDRFRNAYVPFILSRIRLNGSQVLEIGCGTGTSTQALAEQGATVTAIDVDPDSLDIARFRVESAGLQAGFHLVNACVVAEKFKPGSFDAVIFFASLEHMTFDERMRSLRQTWDLLKPGGQLFVLEAPNRLWFFDMHTSFLPFYFWLDRETAVAYGRFSERPIFREAMAQPVSEESFARWGRGVSYHEFELAIGDQSALAGARGMFDFHMDQFPFRRWLYGFGFNARYRKMMHRTGPRYLNQAFYDSFLDIAIRKP